MSNFGKWAAAAVLLGGVSLASAATVTFQDGTPAPFGGGTYDGTQDAHLYWGGDSLTNTGAYPIFGSSGYNQHAILKFDVSSLAGQGTIQSATIKLTGEWNGHLADPFTFSVYQMTDANAGWQQGTRDHYDANPANNQARPGEVCWDYLSYDTAQWAGASATYDPGDNTHGNRGVSVAGTDFIATPLATLTYTQDAAHDGAVYSIDLPASLIEHWISGPNAGVVIIADADPVTQSAVFVSSETPYQPTSWKPALEVTYAPVPEPGTGMLLLGAGGWLLARRRKFC